VIQATVADIIGPTVAANDPYRFSDQEVGNIDEFFGPFGVFCGERLF